MEGRARHSRRVENVANAEDHTWRIRQAQQRLERGHELTIDAAGPFVHDHEVRTKGQRRLLNNRAPRLSHLCGAIVQEPRFVLLRANAIDARQLDVIHPRREGKRLDHRRPRHEQRRGARIHRREQIANYERTADVAQTEGVVRVEKDLGTARRRRSGIAGCLPIVPVVESGRSLDVHRLSPSRACAGEPGVPAGWGSAWSTSVPRSWAVTWTETRVARVAEQLFLRSDGDARRGRDCRSRLRWAPAAPDGHREHDDGGPRQPRQHHCLPGDGARDRP